MALNIFGNQVEGASSVQFPPANNKAVCRFENNTGGDLLVNKAWAKWGSLDSVIHFKAVVYSDNAGTPDTLLHVSNEKTGHNSGWDNFVFATPFTIPAGQFVWVGVIADAMDVSFNCLSTGTIYYNADTYSDGPSTTFGSASTAAFTYPIVLEGDDGASRFGRASIDAGSGNYQPDREHGERFTLGGTDNVQVDSISTYINTTSATVKCKAAIFNDSSGTIGTKIAQTVEVTGSTANSWLTLTFSSPPVIAPGNYWLCFISSENLVTPTTPRGGLLWADGTDTEATAFSSPGTLIDNISPTGIDIYASYSAASPSPSGSTRITQAAILALDLPTPDTYITQAAILALDLPTPDTYITQAAILVLSDDPVSVRITQTAILALTHETPCLQQLCQCWSIARLDGVTLRYTTHDEPVVLQGQIYQPCSSLTATATSGGAVSDTVGDVSVRGLFDTDEITARDMLGGIYDGAIVEVWEQQWGDAEQGFIPRRLARGIVGRTVPADVGYRMELLSPAARLMQRPLLIPHTPACRFDLGDGQCPVALGPLTVTGSVTSLPARDALQRSECRMFSDSGRAEADGYFADGRVTWTSGQNLGASCEVRTNAAGAFTLWAPTAYPIEVGDTYSMSPGCNKTRDDHVTKFGLDMVTFGGWPDLPGNDLMTRTPDAKS